MAELCSAPAWLHRFRHLTFKTLIIPLQPQFIEFMESDGIQIPHDHHLFPSYAREDRTDYSTSEHDFHEKDHELRAGRCAASNLSSPSGHHADLSPDAQPIPSYLFELSNEISRSIEALGGRVFPKLNWSSPRDAAWINLNGLACSTASEVLLLLKSSDFIVHDLELHKHSSQPLPLCLVLKQYVHVPTSLEFRCFVVENQLAAISQREISNFYHFLLGNKQRLHQAIEIFWQQEIKPKFSCDECMRALTSESHHPDVFDVYLTRVDGKVRLVDFNCFGTETTDALLFTWAELKKLKESAVDSALLSPKPVSANTLMPKCQSMDSPSTPFAAVDFRIILSEQQARLYQSSAPRFATSRLPYEVVSLSSGHTVAEYTKELLDRLQSNSDSSDDDANSRLR